MFPHLDATIWILGNSDAPSLSDWAAVGLPTAVQVVGLCSACLTRIRASSRVQAWCRRLFLACLTLVGLVALMSADAAANGPRFLVPYCVTLGVMVLVAIWDSR